MDKMDSKMNRVTPIVKRLDILKRYDEGVPVRRLASEIGVNESTIRKWIKHRVKIEQWSSDEAVSSDVRKRKRMQKEVNEYLDQAVHFWFTETRMRGIFLSGPIIRAQARKMYKEMGCADDFEASNRWLTKFKQRHGIRQLIICGEKLSGDEDAAEKSIQDFSKISQEEQLTPDQVFDCDETGLNFRMLPTKTLVSQSEKSVPGFKKLKDRVTVLACANASGTLKLKLMVIGKSAKPRAFKHINTNRLPVFYRSQKSAWMDSTLFKEWFDIEFVPRVTEFFTEKGLPIQAVLLLDNAPAHSSSAELTNGNIKTIFFPPNTTSLIQPMDQGVLETLKRGYKQKLMNSVVTTINENVNVVQHLKTITIKEVLFWIAEAWEKISTITIQISWQKAWPRTNIPGSNEEERTIIDEEQRVEVSFMNAVREIEGCGDIDHSDLQNWMVNDYITDQMPSNAEIISMARGDGDNEDDAEKFIVKNIDSEEAKQMLDVFMSYVEKEMDLSTNELIALQSLKDKLSMLAWLKK